jgi:hypothetical protein
MPHVKRYEVRPEDVIVVRPGGGGAPVPQPGLGGWLRRHRVRLALLVAAAELLVLVFADVDEKLVVLVGILVVVAYLAVGSSLRPPALRQTAWILAFAQALVGLFPLIIGFSLFVLGAVALLGLLVLAMVMLGDRGR